MRSSSVPPGSVLYTARLEDPPPLPLSAVCVCQFLISFHGCHNPLLFVRVPVLSSRHIVFAVCVDCEKGVSCYVLEMFTENLEPETVLPFLEPLMTRLIQMLQTPKRGIKVSEICGVVDTVVVAVIVVTGGGAFRPFFDKFWTCGETIECGVFCVCVCVRGFLDGSLCRFPPCCYCTFVHVMQDYWWLVD